MELMGAMERMGLMESDGGGICVGGLVPLLMQTALGAELNGFFPQLGDPAAV